MSIFQRSQKTVVAKSKFVTEMAFSADRWHALTRDNAFSKIKIMVFWNKRHWSLFFKVRLLTWDHRLWRWLILNQCWPRSIKPYGFPGPQWDSHITFLYGIVTPSTPSYSILYGSGCHCRTCLRIEMCVVVIFRWQWYRRNSYCAAEILCISNPWKVFV